MDEENNPFRRRLTEAEQARRAEELSARNQPILNYNPDQRPSSSKSFKDEVGPDVVRWILQVKGLGVIVVRSCRTTRVVGMGTFTKDEIGPCPDL